MTRPVAPLSIWIDALNSSGARVVSVDVPSGLSAQTGHAPGAVVVADVTITMLALKPGLLSDDGRDVCGSIVVAPLAEQTAKLVYEADPWPGAARPRTTSTCSCPPRASWTSTRVAASWLVGGSTRFPGAAIMAAKSAARAGAGYVTLAVPEPIANLCRTHLLEIPVVGLPADADGTFSNEARAQVAQLASAVPPFSWAPACA